jgi:hypothetical protein
MATRVNQIIGKTYGFWGVPPSQTLYLFGLAIVLFPVFFFDKSLYFLLLVAVFVGWVVVSGEKPAQFWKQLYVPRFWTYCSPDIRITKAGIPAPLFPKNMFRFHRKKKWWYTEMQHQEFMTFFDYQIDGVNDVGPGAYVLHRKTEAMFIFGWRYTGHDSLSVLQEVENNLNGMFYGLSGLQPHVNLKVYQSSFSGDSGVQEQQEALTKRKNLTLLERLLIGSGIKRIQDMTDSDPMVRQRYGNMQCHQSLVYAKVRLQFGSPPSQNPSMIEKLLAAISAAVGVGITDPNIDHWNKVAFAAYEAFTFVNKSLRNSSNFGFQAQVLSADDLFAIDYRELHPNSEIPLIPQKIVVTRDGLGLPEFNTNTHILGVLLDPESGYSPAIQAENSYIFLPTLNKYAGFVRIGGKSKISSFPSVKGSDELGLYLFWQNILARKGDVLFDYKIIWEYILDDSGIEEINLERTIKGAVGRQTSAINQKTVDVSAQMLQEAAMEAREALESQDKIGFLSIGVWVYRNTIEELNSAINGLIQNMPTTNSERSLYTCEYVWHQTPPYTWQSFLTEPMDDRIKYFAQKEAVPQLPFLSPQRLDNSGSLFLHEQFRTPIYLDFWQKCPNHIALIGETGGSKSVVTFGLILEGNIYSYPSIIFEFPRSDGSSTYTDFLRILKAQGKKVAYIDVRRSRINILERPSFSHIDTSTEIGKQKLTDAIQDIEDSQSALLVSVVLGVSQHSDQETIESWVYRAYRAFLKSSEISERYNSAVQARFGNPGFERMPGLPDFVRFACGSIEITNEGAKCIPGWFQEQIDNDPLLYDGSKKAIDYITNSLRGILDTPLGRSISGPSSFSLEDADCIVLSLTNVSGNRESLVYAQAGLQLILRKAIASNHSACFVEELTTLYMMPAFAKQIATLPPTARKQGMNCAFIFQSIAEPFATSYGAMIFNNLQKIFLLKASEGIVGEVVTHLKFRQEIAESYIGNTISKDILESRLCVRQGNQYFPLTHNPSEFLLSLAATDSEEVAARQRCEALYGNPNDEADIDWLLHFSRLYGAALRSGASMNTILPDLKTKELMSA